MCRLRRYASLCLLALCAVWLSASHASALSLAYDRNYGAAYVNILQGAADVPLEPRGYARNLLDLFQDRRVDAVEIYDSDAAPQRRCTGTRILRRQLCSLCGRTPPSP